MPTVNRLNAAARLPAPEKPGTPITSAAGPDEETVPLPVILGDRPPGHTAGKDGDAVAPVRPASRRADGAHSHRSGSRRPLPAQRQARLDQLKALYRTAEAIGEEAMARHFGQLSQRQHDLICEYFEQAGLGGTGGGAGISGAVPPRVTAPFPPPR